MIRELYIDIDQDYDRFKESKTFGYIKENLNEVKDESKHYGTLYRIYMRKSSMGHVHLKLEIDFFEELPGYVFFEFQLRALLHDDPFRIALDLRRYYYHGIQEINRIFEKKIKDGIDYSAGQWILIWNGDWLL